QSRCPAPFFFLVDYAAPIFLGSTRNDGICPPPLVTFASPVALKRVKNPASFPRNKYGAKSTSMLRKSTLPPAPICGNTSRLTGMRSCTIQQPCASAFFPPGNASSMARSQCFASVSPQRHSRSSIFIAGFQHQVLLAFPYVLQQLNRLSAVIAFDVLHYTRPRNVPPDQFAFHRGKQRRIPRI